MKLTNLLIPAGIATGLYLAFGRKKSPNQPGQPGDIPIPTTGWGMEDREYLARVLIMEAGDIASGPEWAGIAWVAVNRATRRKVSIRDVVAATSWIGGGDDAKDYLEALVSGPGYVTAGDRRSPLDHSRFSEAYDFAGNVLTGQVKNPIGKRENFVHPRGLEKCAWSGPQGKYYCLDGLRYPIWAISTSMGGKAPYEPLKIGRAVFT